MPSPALAYVGFEGGLEPALERVPAAAGVGQLVASDGRNLVLGSSSNLRRWAASQLGLGAVPAAGRRPKTNLAGIAAGIGFALTRGPFHQRLAYERLIAPLVPLSSRRDLRPPAFVQIDLEQRFPRATVTGQAEAAFGPFRDRRSAEKARAAVQKLFRLRPCELRFEPAPELPLGLACLYAQLRSCAAPCLGRVGEGEYRALASSAAAWLADPAARAEVPAAVPSTVGAALSGRALVLDAGRGEVGLFPVVGGRVSDAGARWVVPEALERELPALDWSGPVDPGGAPGASDWPWLTAWLRAPKARASYLVVRDGAEHASLAARARAALPAPAGPPRVGDKVRATRGSD